MVEIMSGGIGGKDEKVGCPVCVPVSVIFLHVVYVLTLSAFASLRLSLRTGRTPFGVRLASGFARPPFRARADCITFWERNLRDGIWGRSVWGGRWARG